MSSQLQEGGIICNLIYIPYCVSSVQAVPKLCIQTLAFWGKPLYANGTLWLFCVNNIEGNGSLPLPSPDYIFLSVMGVGGGASNCFLFIMPTNVLQNAGCYLEDLEEGGSHSPFTSPASWTSPVPAHGTSPVPAHGTSPVPVHGTSHAPDLDLSGPAPDEGDRLWQLTARETSANLQERTRTSQGTDRSLKR
jgi:hypothetical protein